MQLAVGQTEIAIAGLLAAAVNVYVTLRIARSLAELELRVLKTLQKEFVSKSECDRTHGKETHRGPQLETEPPLPRLFWRID